MKYWKRLVPCVDSQIWATFHLVTLGHSNGPAAGGFLEHDFIICGFATYSVCFLQLPSGIPRNPLLMDYVYENGNLHIQVHFRFLPEAASWDVCHSCVSCNGCFMVVSSSWILQGCNTMEQQLTASDRSFEFSRNVSTQVNPELLTLSWPGSQCEVPVVVAPRFCVHISCMEVCSRNRYVSFLRTRLLNERERAWEEIRFPLAMNSVSWVLLLVRIPLSTGFCRKATLYLSGPLNWKLKSWANRRFQHEVVARKEKLPSMNCPGNILIRACVLFWLNQITKRFLSLPQRKRQEKKKTNEI